MKIIEKIEIKHFRSFGEKTKISDINDLNIFSGANDSGKSNILRALNLFFHEDKIDFYHNFNFENDFSRVQEEILKGQKKGKSFIEIRVLFCPLKKQFNSKVLPDKFWIIKRFYRDNTKNFIDIKNENGKDIIHTREKNGKIIERKEDVSKAKTNFLKKINFQYIPAIKDEKFSDYLKEKYQDAIGKAENELDKVKSQTIENWKKEMTSLNITKILDEKIKEESKKLFEDFAKRASEIKKANFNIPYLEIAYSSAIDVETDEKIPLKNRGDGVQAKFIPVILDEIAKRNKEKPIVIWAFEEPENSYEYKNAQKLADDFLNEYSEANQIFITTHSFNFLSLNSGKVSTHRIYKEELKVKGRDNEESNHFVSRVFTIPNDADNLQKKLIDLKHPEREKLEEELGIYELNGDLKKIYEEKEKEKKEYLEKKKEINRLIASKKKVLFTEGPTDKIILEKAWKKLYPKIQRDFEIIAMGGAGHLQNYIQNDFPQQTEKRTGVALFDFDQKGYEQWNGINEKNKFSIDKKKDKFCKGHSNKKIFATLLTVPSHLKEYVFNDQSEVLSVPNLRLETEHFLILKSDDKTFLKLFPKCGKERGIYELPNKKPSVEKYIEIIDELTKKDFENFKPLFEKIKTLFGV